MKVSVVIPMYNSAAFIEKTLRCVLAQDFQDFEIVVVNDGSTDGSLEIVRAIGDSRIRIIDKPNTGASDTRNRGNLAAKGEYIASLDSDDYWYPDHLSEAMEFFAQHADMAWYGARQQSLVFGEEPPAERDCARKFSCHNFFVDGKSFIHSSSMVFRRDVLEPCVEYPVDMRYFEDWVFQSRIAAKHPLVGTNERVTSVYFRQRSDSVSAAPPLIPDIHYEAFRHCLHILEHCVIKSNTKVPLWVWGLLRVLFRTAMFHCPLEEIMGFVDEFSALQGRMRTARWQSFLKRAYALAHGLPQEKLVMLTALASKRRYGMTFDVYRDLGVVSAFKWFCIVFLYSCRGIMDKIQDKVQLFVSGNNLKKGE